MMDALLLPFWAKFMLAYILLAIWFAWLINHYSRKDKTVTAVAALPEPDKPREEGGKKYPVTTKMVVSFFYSDQRGWQVIHWHTLPSHAGKELYEIEIPVPDEAIEEQLKRRTWLGEKDKTSKP